MPGICAAGGLALPFVAFMGAELRPGLEIVLDVLKFDRHLQGADFVVTGEGRTDEQSAMGKVLCGVSGRAAAQGIPVVALSGALEKGYDCLLYTSDVYKRQGVNNETGTAQDLAAIGELIKKCNPSCLFRCV